MAKIIEINNELVFVGMPDGSIQQFDIEDFETMPKVGQNIELYKNGDINIIGVNGKYNYVEKLTVNKFLYCFCALFLGGIGVHKFYAKHFVTGIWFLLFSWTYIPAIIAFFEFLAALFIKSDKNGNIKV